jgi:preprotein translocase subunit SecA
MDGLREAVYLRAYGQKDPLTEYKTEAYAMFVELMESIKNEVLNNLFRSTTNLQAFEQLLASMPRHLLQQDLLGAPHLGEGGEPDTTQAPAPTAAQSVFEQAMQQKPVQRVQKTAGRNDPCPCGSGKKFKSCCGRTA